MKWSLAKEITYGRSHQFWGVAHMTFFFASVLCVCVVVCGHIFPFTNLRRPGKLHVVVFNALSSETFKAGGALL